MMSLLITAAPLILKLIGFFFKDKEERAKARIRFLKYIESKEEFTQKPVEMRTRFRALRAQAEEEARAKALAQTEEKEAESEAKE